MARENKFSILCLMQFGVIVVMVPEHMVNKYILLLENYVQRRPQMLR